MLELQLHLFFVFAFMPCTGNCYTDSTPWNPEKEHHQNWGGKKCIERSVVQTVITILETLPCYPTENQVLIWSKALGNKFGEGVRHIRTHSWGSAWNHRSAWICFPLYIFIHHNTLAKKNQLYQYTEKMNSGMIIREKIWEINFFLISASGENKEIKTNLHKEKRCLW